MTTAAHEHKSFIQTPKMLLAVVVLAFVVPVVFIIFLTQLVTGGPRTESSNPDLAPDAVRARIQPVATVRLAGASGPRVELAGEQVFKNVCSACHATGVLKAPKVGDNAAWAKLISQGLPAILADALKGIGQMPPRGGNADLSDDEVARAIVYMANQSGANWKEPPLKPAAGAAKPAAEAAK